MNEANRENGGPLNDATFDAARAAQLRTTALSSFQAGARKVERYLYVCLTVCMASACVMIRNLLEATETQAQIFWAVLFLLMFESTILMRVWYWVVRTRLSTQQEIRLLRFDLAAGKDSMSGLEELAQHESPLRPAGLSRWERRAWTAAILTLGVAVGLGGDLRFLKFLATNGAAFENAVTLQADGHGQQRTRWTYRNRSLAMLREVPLYGGLTQTEFTSALHSPYRDSTDRSLAVRRDRVGENCRDLIQLAKPVPATGQAEIRWTTTVRAGQDGALWVYEVGPGNNYDTTVTLPPGAEVVSVEPAEASRRMDGDALSLRFTAAGNMASHRITYRMPAAANARPE